MRTVLLTGATGFIGRYCLRPLVSAGYEVHAVSSKRAFLETPGVHWHKADLLDSGQTKQLMTDIRPTHLLHLAWNVTPGEYWESAENILWLQASLELLRLFASVGGQRVVIAGTCAEYDWQDGICKEDTTPLAPTSLYGACKHSLQIAATAFARGNKLSLAWGRIFFLYGPHEHPSRLVPSVIRALLAGKSADCSDGHQRRDFLFVTDVAEAFVALLNSSVSGAVNIASGEAVAVKDVVRTIAKKLSQADLVRFGKARTVDTEPPLIVGDVARLKTEVHWSPRFPLADGLDQVIRWWEMRGTPYK